MALGDRIAERVAQRRSQIVLGLDPDPARLWPRALELARGAGGGAGARTGLSGTGAEIGLGGTGAEVGSGAGAEIGSGGAAQRASRAVAAHCRLLLDAAGEQCVAVKPQVACFERLGAPGWAALAEVVDDARTRGLIVIADAKRGDVDITAHAYGQAFFGPTPSPFGDLPGLGADLLTASPLLGRDSLAALLDEARGAGGGLLVLVRTSNPGAADVQDRALHGGGAVSDALAGIVDELGRPEIGSHGLSDVGAVCGATAPGHLERLRGEMPHAVMLLPGVGAQGAGGEGLGPAFAPGPAGGLVSASRSIVYASQSAGGDPAAAARDEAARLRELVWGLYA